MQPENLIRKVARNTGFNAMGFLVTASLVFLVTPYSLHRLGPERFGIWALGGVVNSLALLLDFGISRALIKYIAEYNARREFGKLVALVNTGLLLYIGLALGGGGILFAFLGALIGPLFSIPIELQSEAWFVFMGLILIAMWTLVLNMFDSLLNGLQRLDLTNALSTIMQMLSAAGVLIALEGGYGLRGMVIKNAIIAGLTSIVYLYLMRRVLPGLYFDWRQFRPGLARELLRFGSNIQLVNVVVLILEPLNKTLISRFLDLNFVTYYEIATRVISLVVGLFQSLVLAIYPAVSEVSATRGRQAVTQLYIRSTRYMTILALPVFSLLILAVEPFLRVWIGPGYETAAVTLQLLAASRFFSILGMTAYFVIQAIGQPRLSMISSIYTGISGFVLSTAMLLIFGYYGLVMGNAIAMATGSFVMFFLFHRETLIPWKALLERFPVQAAIINLVIAGMGVLYLVHFGHTSLLPLLILALIYLTTYGLGLFAAGALDAEDRLTLKHLIPDSWAALRE